MNISFLVIGKNKKRMLSPEKKFKSH